MELLEVLLAAFFCMLICHRVLLVVIPWLLKRALNVDVSIQRLGFFYVQGIKISLPQHTLEIKRVSLRFSNTGRERICIFVDGFSIVEHKRAAVNDSPNHGPRRDEVKLQISPELVAITKWIEVEVCDLSIHSEVTGLGILHSSTTKVDLYFLEQNVNECLIAKANLCTTTVAVYSTPLTVESSARNILSAEYKFMSSWSTSIEATASLANGSFSLQKLSVEIEDLDVDIKEKLSALINGKCHQEITGGLHPVAKQSILDSIHHFSSFILKEFHLGIRGVEVSGMKGSTSPYTMSVRCCSLDLSNILEKQGNGDGCVLNPHLSIIFCVNNVEMEINLLETIIIEEFSVTCKVKNEVLKSDAILKSVAIVYHHEELMKWLRENFKIPLLKKHNGSISALRNNSCADYGYGELWSKADITLQMSRFSAKYFPSPRELLETASLEVDFVKLKYEKPQDLRTGEITLDEIIVKNLWCHLGRMPFDQIYRKDKHHVWGSPVFVQLLRVKKSKPGINPGPVDVILSSVEVEWTPHLPQVALGALRCMVDFQKTISNLSMQKVVKSKPNGQQLSSYCPSSSMNLTILDCNVYLLDDLAAKDRKKVDLCYMLRFDTITYQYSLEKICFDVEGFKAITILQDRTGHHACATCEALKGYWLHVKRLQGLSHQPFGEMSVGLKEKIELFWNEDLHTRFSDITSSVQDFFHSVCELYYPSQPNSRSNAEYSMSLTIQLHSQAKVVVDLFQSMTQLHIFLSEAAYILSGQEKCIKMYISNVKVLKGAIIGLNTASFCALYNQFMRGYIHHAQSNTSLFISVDPIIEKGIQTMLVCEFLRLCWMLW